MSTWNHYELTSNMLSKCKTNFKLILFPPWTAINMGAERRREGRREKGGGEGREVVSRRREKEVEKVRETRGRGDG